MTEIHGDGLSPRRETPGSGGRAYRSSAPPRQLPTRHQRLGVEAIDSGLITMRRTTGPTWFRADESPDTMAFPAGDDIVRTFEAEDFLAAHADDRALLGARYRVASDTRLTQEFRPADDSWDLVATQLRRSEGLHWWGSIDIPGANVLGRCDGTRPIADLLAELASSLGSDAEEMAQLWPALVRRLVKMGFLLPVRP